MTVKRTAGDIYDIIEIDLSTAHSETEIAVFGYSIYRLYLDGELYISLEEPDNPPIKLNYVAEISLPAKIIKYIYITNEAQVDKKAILLIAKIPTLSTLASRLGAVQVQNASGLTINPATEETLQEIAKRLQFKREYSGNITVPAGSSVTWLSVSGSGVFLEKEVFKSTGIPASHVYDYFKLDDNYYHNIMHPTIAEINTLGLTTVGIYNIGNRALHVVTWDTVNHDYITRFYTAPMHVHFKSSLEVQFKNTYTTDATMVHEIAYSLYVSTKKIILSTTKDTDKQTPKVLKKLLKDKGIPVEAITKKIQGYIEDESTLSSINREILGNTGNEYDVIFTLKNGNKIYSRKAHTAFRVTEIYVPDETETDKILKHLHNHKFIMEVET